MTKDSLQRDLDINDTALLEQIIFNRDLIMQNPQEYDAVLKELS